MSLCLYVSLMDFEGNENVYESWDEHHTISNHTTVIVFSFCIVSNMSLATSYEPRV